MNNVPDTMTNQPLPDDSGKQREKSLPLPFASSEIEMAGIRVTRAEFSRMMGCSKQAVTDWVKSGRVVVGADGRLDPRQAVASLLRTGDPSKIRARVLEPLVRDISGRDRRIAELEASLEQAREDASYHEGSCLELLRIIEAIPMHLDLAWDRLLVAKKDDGLAAVHAWLSHSVMQGRASSSISEHLHVAAPVVSDGQMSARPAVGESEKFTHGDD